MIDAEGFRQLVLEMEGAIEGAHMNHPDFRANGRIFATIYPDGVRGMVKLTPDQQRELIRLHRAMFEPASGAWGRQGCTTVNFEAADAATLRAAITIAWENVLERPKLRPRKPKQPTRPSRPVRQR